MRQVVVPFAFAIGLYAAPVGAASGDITAIEDLQRDTPVTVQGTVDRITSSDEFYLRDETGAVRVYVGPNRIPAEVGENITIIGKVDEDRKLEVYAFEIIRADGSRVELPHRY
jgi:uncharacterized protein YdeI (BOF family)